MKIEELLLIGGACLAGFFLWKQFSGSADLTDGGGGGGGGGFDWSSLFTPGGGGDTNGTDNGGGLPDGSGGTTGNGGHTNVPIVTQPVTTSQSWTNVTYGQSGQPSTAFLVNTLKEGGTAAAAAYAGAPPRIVAKIKAGKIY